MPTFDLVSCHWAVRPHPSLLGRARAMVVRFLLARGVDPECRERAVIACDELLRNAVDHVGHEAVLSVCVRPEDVRIAVTDRRPAHPRNLWGGMTARSGLTLVWQLSHSLHVMPVGEGKTIAAEISRRDPGPEQLPADWPTSPLTELL